MSDFVMDFDKVVAAMRARSLKGDKTMSVKVGYSAPYAVFVHEDMQTHHDVGQAKYLSTPSKDAGVRARMREAVKKKLLARRSLEEACIDTGNILLSESRPLVPVDTGFLRESAWIDTVSRGRIKPTGPPQDAPDPYSEQAAALAGNML